MTPVVREADIYYFVFFFFREGGRKEQKYFIASFPYNVLSEQTRNISQPLRHRYNILKSDYYSRSIQDSTVDYR